MKDVLTNPVFHALCSGDRELSLGSADVKYFDEEVSPFVGIADQYNLGFQQLYDIFPGGRRILHACPEKITIPKGWQLKHEIEGLQFVFEGKLTAGLEFSKLVSLEVKHVTQMIDLAILTKPGPFAKRTIEFGSYYGIFENEVLVAMTGQRLHVYNYSEISAVCTHPDHSGKGYARTLLQHQLMLILQQGQIPFLHVRADNQRAIELYEKSGFVVSRPMNFYFLKKEG